MCVVEASEYIFFWSCCSWESSCGVTSQQRRLSLDIFGEQDQKPSWPVDIMQLRTCCGRAVGQVGLTQGSGRQYVLQILVSGTGS